MCEHFDILEEIYCAKANVNPPYTNESASSDIALVATTYSRSGDFDTDDWIENDPNDEFQEQLSERNIVESNAACSSNRIFRGATSTITSASRSIATIPASVSAISHGATTNIGSSRAAS